MSAIGRAGKMLVCQLCEHRALYPSDLKKHLTVKHSLPAAQADQMVPSKRSFACNCCSDSYRTRNALIEHLRKDHGLPVSIQKATFDTEQGRVRRKRRFLLDRSRFRLIGES